MVPALSIVDCLTSLNATISPVFRKKILSNVKQYKGFALRSGFCFIAEVHLELCKM